MILKGLQKLTLLDYPEKCACTVFTYGCNLRCPFCHNASLVNPNSDPSLTEDYFFSFLSSRKNLLDGVAVTGGEPLLQPDVFDFLRKIKGLGYLVKLDTNGTSPKKLKEAIDLGLVDYVAMDIKNSPSKYAETSGVENLNFDDILESVAILKEGKIDYEFRTTVCVELFDEDDFYAIGDMLAGAKAYYLQGFEDSGDVLNGVFTKPSKSLLNTYAKIVKNKVEKVGLRGLN